MSAGFWLGKRVFVTGHTGFKGSWLTLMLERAGAEVHGYSTSPPTTPNLFTVAHVAQGMAAHTSADVRDLATLRAALVEAAPEIVFHLAAQSLVRTSYEEPVETYAVNVLGTVHLLQAVRDCPSVRALIVVTTDKCYADTGDGTAYRETDALGGHDPYSSSKACAELVTAAYRDSYFAAAGVGVATARAGNVIGGGDWAHDRLIPDFLRALDEGRPAKIRHPQAVRPWQHVLEPLSGYMLLARQLFEQTQARSGAWNFGPAESDARPVAWVLDRLCAASPDARWEQSGGNHVHESAHLMLDSNRARDVIGWQPRWELAMALERTLEWHAAWRRGEDMRAVCLRQIDAHGRPAA